MDGQNSIGIRIRLCHECHNDMIRAIMSSTLHARSTEIKANKLYMDAMALAGRPENHVAYHAHCRAESVLDSDTFDFMRDFISTKPE